MSVMAELDSGGLRARGVGRVGACCAALFLAMTLTARTEGAAEPTAGPYDNFCAEAQSFISNTGVPPTNVVHEGYDPFVKSKPEVDESKLITHQYYFYDESAGDEAPLLKVISCKMKSADRIASFHGDDSAGPQLTCGDLNKRTVNMVLSRLSMMDPPVIAYEDDDKKLMGPDWLNPWPFEPVHKTKDGTLSVGARSLYVAYSKLIPMPAQFKGVHYCHLLAPDYAEALLMGRVEAPSSN